MTNLVLTPCTTNPRYAAFLREFHASTKEEKDPTAVQLHNQARSLAIIANGKARDKFFRINRRWPSPEEIDRMMKAGILVEVPSIARDSDEVMLTKRRTPGMIASPALVNRVKRKELNKRTEATWIRLIMNIEDETLRLGVAKKVFWDFFGKRGWKGLDELLHEPNSTIVRFFSKYDHPDVEELRLALWDIGYPISIIREFYPDDHVSGGVGKGFKWVFSSVQDDT